MVYSINGSFCVRNQRYIMADGSPSDYLSQCCKLGKGHYTEDLCSYIEEWSDELSYRKMSKLLTRQTGCTVLGHSGIGSYLSCKAVSISAAWVAASKPQVSNIAVLASISLYDCKSEEVILMMDDVGVKAQKPHKKLSRMDCDAKRLDTTVVLVQDSEQHYHCATKGIDKVGNTVYSIEQAIIDKVSQFHDTEKPIPLVAITDGASSIRSSLQKVFGLSVCIVLDWYHLQLKIKKLMSMIAVNKNQKELHIKVLKAFLWVGNSSAAIQYIYNITEVKNEIKQKELRDYLQKHAAEIIDYGLRKSANKTIGSGRAEKYNDLIVAHRQKKKGMAWARVGTASLAIIRTKNINNNLKMSARTSGQ